MIGLKNSRRRDVILRAFSLAGEHLTVDELYDRAKKADPVVGYTTVWRTLKLLESCGHAVSRKFHDGHTRYEYVGKQRHHDHLICVKCGHVEEFLNARIEDIQQQVASRHGFAIISHKMELYGYCRECKTKGSGSNIKINRL